MGAIVLNRAVIGSGCVVGAGALVTEDKSFPDNTLIIGSPAKGIRRITPEDLEKIRRNAQVYVELGRNQKKESII